MENQNNSFTVQCACCKMQYENWIGSTPCCGSIAYLLDEKGETTNVIKMFTSINNGPIQVTDVKKTKK